MSEKQLKDEQRHKQKMQRQKKRIDARIAGANEDRGVLILLTGDGKGKTSSAFGMIMRALGYGYRVGVVQFIKGEQLSGEELFLKDVLPQVDFYQMGTGFTWDTQDRARDIEAAEKTWSVVEPMLSDHSYHLVILDEITYMLSFKYLDEERVVNALTARPRNQSVVLTGRGGVTAIREIADTVSEVKEVRHAYNSGIKARRGGDF